MFGIEYVDKYEISVPEKKRRMELLINYLLFLQTKVTQAIVWRKSYTPSCLDDVSDKYFRRRCLHSFCSYFSSSNTVCMYVENYHVNNYFSKITMYYFILLPLSQKKLPIPLFKKSQKKCRWTYYWN